MAKEFWQERYRQPDYVYGEAPNAFIAQSIHYLPEGACVVELGSGEGRNAVFLATQGFQVTAVDFASSGLEKTRRLARQKGVSLRTIEADVLEWMPAHPFDAVITSFLHLPPEQRPLLYRHITQHVLKPGGWLIAEWFRPEQRTQGYTSGGPPTPELMVTEEELRTYFPDSGIRYLKATATHLAKTCYRSLTFTPETLRTTYQ